MIERCARPRGAFWRKNTFSIWHREGLDRRAAKLVALASGLPHAGVPERLAKLVAKFADAQTPRSIVPAETAPEQQPVGERVHNCPACLTRYDQDVGDPEQRIVPGTPFGELPAAWTCPLCEAPKAAFVAMA